MDTGAWQATVHGVARVGHSLGTSPRFPGGSEVKASAWNEGEPGSILVREDPLEKEMATQSSTLAWKLPWTEEPGMLQSMGSQRVGHD